jgi:hypothetical protein
VVATVAAEAADRARGGLLFAVKGEDERSRPRGVFQKAREWLGFFELFGGKIGVVLARCTSACGAPQIVNSLVSKQI